MDVHHAHGVALEAAATGTAALRSVWPALVRAMEPAEAAAIRDALRALEDGWASLAAVEPTAHE